MARLWSNRGLVVWGVIGVVALVGWATSARRGADGAITSAGDLEARELQVGDCLDEPEGQEFDEVRALPCAEPHDLEIFHSFPASSPSYPSDAVFFDLAVRLCVPAFEAYVGSDYDVSDLDIGWFTPSRESWATGDRTVHCLAFALDGSPLTGSVRGSGR